MVFFQRDPHIPFFSFLRVCTGAITARMASSNTSFNPCFQLVRIPQQNETCVSAEHSMYLIALISLAFWRPYKGWILFSMKPVRKLQLPFLCCNSLVCLFVFSEIHFETNKDNRSIRAVPRLSTIRNHLPEMMHFWLPFSWHILQRGGIRDRKANQEDICLRVSERLQPG